LSGEDESTPSLLARHSNRNIPAATTVASPTSSVLAVPAYGQLAAARDAWYARISRFPVRFAQ
jgi:hypothetical protein